MTETGNMKIMLEELNSLEITYESIDMLFLEDMQTA